ncbi:hypothetical protein CALVIDRAFT_596521 [Calocera viscosa TUFC12733]|uniref:Uncharacterized protein n=1 Tax=Calocera viscosa (strain TUFC12733) TaxID=1330018 RepID=A0A167PLI9_CALVF|nr:hypothetical protein CALVIDRAFT_596521 [Calocera viscosa TUFC12733]
MALIYYTYKFFKGFCGKQEVPQQQEEQERDAHFQQQGQGEKPLPAGGATGYPPTAGYPQGGAPNVPGYGGQEVKDRGAPNNTGPGPSQLSR